MRWNPFASPPPLPENLSLLDRVQDRLGRVHELANRELVMTRALLTDFQEFIQQGNMLNMAVGLILGSSFSAILNSLVAPIISLFTARGIANHYWPLRCPSTTPQCSNDSWQTWKEARDAGAVTINYGLFIENIMNFVINALFLFFAVKKALEVVFKLKVGVKKQCQYCKEFVKGAATRCKECDSDIRTPPSAG
ncbi:hypothetical protein PF005_g15462 [Phytophthora fragariae]|uniref:Large conductance mechanosensitive channel protein n=1 Tax=Phytophthora fragariae TaxID=53985 RepID=A0A6A3EHW3_9STRA|nr:hypothetical protein PF003_g38351 [Phytophthora fragariae]KAE8933294.1 hypothetical protein PF009_g16687 [Phytophthora fragariae]KAE8999702.1 hypothetical protein PF011_g14512 [Phytophthora fragariae]KAE9099704.1 hypothetical protein PF007_g15775 [Phytophthora fragariae]KAE9099749.1 hypothetical protein PF010_g15077 [Phytophthora fragariae]